MVNYRFRFVVLLAMTMAVLSANTSAQEGNTSTAASLESIVNPDGSLKIGAGVGGSYSAEGWRLQLGPQGEPRLFRDPPPEPQVSPAGIRADTADIHWDNRFVGPYGVDGVILAIAVNGSDVYFGGSFNGTDAIEAFNIVRWNGTNWSPLGQGTDGPVYALAFAGADLYVAGSFTQAGGAPANSIARWNGSAWSTLGASPNDGVQGYVYSLLYVGTSLYVGGSFVSVGSGVSANYIARWSGSSWFGLGTGVNSNVITLATNGTDLFVGGYFTTAGGSPAKLVARWNGSTWFPLGTPPNDGLTGSFAYSMAFHNGSLYVGGYFSKAGTVTATNVARWSGSAWSALGNGLNSYVISLLADGPAIYAAGYFTASGITTINRAAKWDTTAAEWSGLAAGVNSPVMALAKAGADIYAGGYFTSYTNAMTPAPSNHIARWSGSAWSALGESGNINSIDGSTIRVIATNGADVYIGGSFITAGAIAANNIVKWNSSSNTWSSLGQGAANGVDNTVYAIHINGTDIYVGGSFLSAGGLPANRIARWSGSTWSTLGISPNDGATSTVYCILFAGGNLYVGGSFSTVGSSLAANRVARWNGSAWAALGTGLNSTVYALETLGSDLYAGGAFSTAGGAPANRIARWNGTAWSTLGTSPNDGVSSTVYALEHFGPYLYVGGSFTNAGGTIMVNRIARWNGSSWSALGNGFNGTVYGLYGNGTSLLATGNFTLSGIAPVNRIARWDTTGGIIWRPLGSGLNSTGYALATAGDDVYAGGTFTQAGSKPSFKFAHWNKFLVTSVSPEAPLPAAYRLDQNYPNPFNPSTMIRYSVAARTDVQLTVYTILGEEIRTLDRGIKPAGMYEVTFDGAGLASGVYLCRLVAGNYTETKRLILVR